MMKKRFLEAGRIVNTHGLKGELKILPWTDSADFLLDFDTIYIDEKPVHIISGRVHKGCIIAVLEGITDINDAMRYKNKVIYIDREDVELPEGDFFIQDIIGAKVVDENNQELGKLVDVMENPSSNVYVVQGEREILIPAVPEFVLSTDADEGVIVVRLIEGM